MSEKGQTALTVYPLAHYKFGKKGPKVVKDESQEQHFDRLKTMTEIEGLRRKLLGKLSPESESLKTDWEVGECICSFWRPNHHPSVYPYSPAHVTNPKEVVKLFTIPLPERCYFANELRVGGPITGAGSAVLTFKCYDGASYQVRYFDQGDKPGQPAE